LAATVVRFDGCVVEGGEVVSPNPSESQSVPSVWPEPPSLLHRGPARFHLRLRTGQCPRIGRGRIHVRAGRTLIIVVAPPNPEAQVEIRPAPGLYTEVSPNRVSTGSVPEYHAEYAGHFPRLSIPWPYTAGLCVAVLDGLPNPYRVTIPVTVWPSVGRLLTWWLVVFIGVLGLRWQNVVVQSKTYQAIFTEIYDDLSFAGGVLLLGIPIIAGLQALWMLLTMQAPDES